MKTAPPPHEETAAGFVEHELPALRPGRASRRAALSALAVAVIASFAAILWGGRLFNPAGGQLLGEFLATAARPDLSEDFLRITAQAAFTTVAFAAAGAGASVAIGGVLGIVASQSWWGHGRRRSWRTVRAVLAFPRGIHEAVWALLLVNILGLDPLVGVLGIAIPYTAITARVFAEIFDEADAAPFASLRNQGAGRIKSFAYSILPQCSAELISYSFYRFECAIRAAAILGVIGAGGLGFQMALSFQALQYREMWTLIYALVAISGLADLWSTAVRRRRAAGRAGPGRDRFVVGSVAGVAALVGLSAAYLDLNPAHLWGSRAAAETGRLISGLFPPAWDKSLLGDLVPAALATVAMANVAGFLAWEAGAAAAFGAAGRKTAGLSAAWKVVLLFFRAIPPPVWAFVFLFVAFPGPLPGMLALAAYNFGVLGRLMAESVEASDAAPARALAGSGAGRAKAFFYATLPLSMGRFSALGIYRWEVTMREVVVVGLVGAGGLGRLLGERLAAFDLPAVSSVLLALVGLTLAADFAGAYLRRAIR
ncbi:MAG: PhnE/PtxC family ABC transporter permease [Actinomycetota bacterium]